MHVAMWREHDFMRQCKNNFEEIPWKFRGRKETGTPHCRREDELRS
jgi:hypothetical protein